MNLSNCAILGPFWRLLFIYNRENENFNNTPRCSKWSVRNIKRVVFGKLFLAGLVSLEKQATPRSRGHSFCIGCDAATNGQWPWQGGALRTIFKNGVKPPHQSPID